MFSEGYAASSGPSLLRVDLSSDALRLTRLLHRALPDEPEVAGLLALMLLTDARGHARTSPDGGLIPLDEQDRTQWNAAAIEEGTNLVAATLPRGAVGPYQVQAQTGSCSRWSRSLSPRETGGHRRALPRRAVCLDARQRSWREPSASRSPASRLVNAR